jgi:hypothetical protein
VEIRIDENGKFFTTHVNKMPQIVVIHTSDHLLIGTIHIPHNHRVIDALNTMSEPFLAITDAQVYTKDGTQLIYTSELLVCAYRQIIMLSPLELVVPAQAVPWHVAQ